VYEALGPRARRISVTPPSHVYVFFAKTGATFDDDPDGEVAGEAGGPAAAAGQRRARRGGRR
jgi:hypothetical protein